MQLGAIVHSHIAIVGGSGLLMGIASLALYASAARSVIRIFRGNFLSLVALDTLAILAVGLGAAGGWALFTRLQARGETDVQMFVLAAFVPLIVARLVSEVRQGPERAPFW